MSGTLTLTVGWNDTITVTGVASVLREGDWLISTGEDGAERRTSLYSLLSWKFVGGAEKDGKVYPILNGGVGYAMTDGAENKPRQVLEAVA